MLCPQRGEVPLGQNRSSDYERQACAIEQINAFVSDATAADLTARLNTKAGRALSAALIAFNIGITPMSVRPSPTTTWTFDQSTGLITRTQRFLA